MNSEVFSGRIKRMVFGNENTPKAFCRLQVIDSEDSTIKNVVVFKDAVESLRERDIQTNEEIRVKGRPVGKIVAESIDRVVEEA